MELKSGQIITDFSEIESIVNEVIKEMNISIKSIHYTADILEETDFYNASKEFLSRDYHVPFSDKFYSTLYGFKILVSAPNREYLFFIKSGAFELVYSVFMHEIGHVLNEGTTLKFAGAPMVGSGVSEMMAFVFQYWAGEVLDTLYPELNIDALYSFAAECVANDKDQQLKQSVHGAAISAISDLYKQMPYPKSFGLLYKELQQTLSRFEKIEVISE